MGPSTAVICCKLTQDEAARARRLAALFHKRQYTDSPNVSQFLRCILNSFYEYYRGELDYELEGCGYWGPGSGWSQSTASNEDAPQ